jgi:hypothetical protein
MLLRLSVFLVAEMKIFLEQTESRIILFGLLHMISSLKLHQIYAGFMDHSYTPFKW